MKLGAEVKHRQMKNIFNVNSYNNNNKKSQLIVGCIIAPKAKLKHSML